MPHVHLSCSLFCSPFVTNTLALLRHWWLKYPPSTGTGIQTQDLPTGRGYCVPCRDLDTSNRSVVNLIGISQTSLKLLQSSLASLTRALHKSGCATLAIQPRATGSTNQPLFFNRYWKLAKFQSFCHWFISSCGWIKNNRYFKGEGLVWWWHPKLVWKGCRPSETALPYVRLKEWLVSPSVVPSHARAVAKYD